MMAVSKPTLERTFKIEFLFSLIIFLIPSFLFNLFHGNKLIYLFDLDCFPLDYLPYANSLTFKV